MATLYSVTSSRSNALTQADLNNLAKSWITPELAQQAGIFRVDQHEGAAIVGRNGSGDYSGLVFPYYWPGESKPREYRLRRDRPDIEYKNGKPREKEKYLSPPGGTNKLYFMPNTDPAALTDTSIPVIFTEGEKKTVALYRLSIENNLKWLPIGLAGAWNWRGIVAKEPGPNGDRRNVKGPIPDLERIQWRGRQVYLIYDANVESNASVKAARRELARELRQRGAEVSYVDLPTDAGINGVDDLLAEREPARVLDLFANAKSSEGDLIGFNRTDAGNGEAFAYLFGDRVRYDHKRKLWLIWRDHWWAAEDDGELTRLAIEAARELYRQAVTIQDPDEREKVAKWAIKSEARKSVEDRLTLAKVLPPIADNGERWDADPMLLAVADGVLDLRTGELRPGAREDRITQHSDVVFDPHADCSMWLSFLDRIMGGNENLVRFLQRAIGYSLTGRTDEQCLFFLYGCGANGKSTLVTTIIKLLGSYARQCAPDLLIVKYNDPHPTGLADTAGSRFLATIETDDGKRLAESLVKQMTGGDRLKARKMRQDFFEFEGTFKLWLAANHKPTIRGTDHAIWRRIKLVPFDVQIPEAERDKTLADKIAAELSGVLNWAIQGCLEWQRIGLAEPDEVKKATAAYRAEMDVIADFLDECCIIQASASVSARSLWNEYRKWTERTGETPMTRRMFGSRLTERGFERGHARDGDVYRGIGLIAGVEL